MTEPGWKTELAAGLLFLALVIGVLFGPLLAVSLR